MQTEAAVFEVSVLLLLLAWQCGAARAAAAAHRALGRGIGGHEPFALQIREQNGVKIGSTAQSADAPV